MSVESVQQQLLEASELLEIAESYFSLGSMDAVAINGIRVLLRESRARVSRVSKQLNSNGASSHRNQGSSNSLAARIQRLPEGEFRSIELDLDSDIDDARE